MLILDKTGTLTEGHPKLTQIVTSQGYEENDILMLAASLESSSEHPLAKAIVIAAKEKNLLPLSEIIVGTSNNLLLLKCKAHDGT